MPEWFKGPVLKTGGRDERPGGSNPSPTAMKDSEIRIESSSSDKYFYLNAYLPNVESRVGKLGIEYKGDKSVKIIYVITDINHTGCGIATALLNRAIETFKGYEIKLNVVPMPRQGESLNHRTTTGLVNFYKKFGFERTDDPCFVEMIKKN